MARRSTRVNRIMDALPTAPEQDQEESVNGSEAEPALEREEPVVTDVAERELKIPVISRSTQVLHLLGTRPLYMNTMAEKAWQQLLSPSGRKNQAERQQSQKHDPVREFRDSAFTFEGKDSATLLGFPADAVKRMLEDACELVPRTSVYRVRSAVKVSDGDLPYAPGHARRPFSRDDKLVTVYGTPFLMMDIVRVKGVPDVRTRAFLPRWAMKIRVTYTKTIVDLNEIAKLFAFGGEHIGLGDWRTQNGGDFGECMLVPGDDPEFTSIVEEARAEQEAAMETPMYYDAHTARLMEWFASDLAGKKAKRMAEAGAKAAADKKVRRQEVIKAGKGQAHMRKP